MDQVEELLHTIAAHKLMGVTGAFVMFSFFKRRASQFSNATYLDSSTRALTVRRSRAPPSQAGAVRRGCSPLRPAAVRVTESSKTGKYSTTFVENELCFAAAN
jgi:hypothetical protein